jgi:hypothetical protein
LTFWHLGIECDATIEDDSGNVHYSMPSAPEATSDSATANKMGGLGEKGGMPLKVFILFLMLNMHGNNGKG